jgi:anti-anti-sigma factor
LTGVTALILPWRTNTSTEDRTMQSTATFTRESDRLFVIGELDLASAPQLEAALADLDGARLVVDLSMVEFIDSSGIHALSRVRRTHPHVTIENPSPRTRRILDLVGATEMLIDGDGVTPADDSGAP